MVFQWCGWMVNGILMVETGKFACFDGKLDLVIHNMVYDIDTPSSKGSEPCKRQDCPYTLINAHQVLTQYMYPVLFHKTAYDQNVCLLSSNHNFFLFTSVRDVL